MPKVSVVMPVYNREDFVKKAVQSILDQSFSDFEFIIINDGSTDKSEEILKSFNDKRIKYFYQENAGEYPATNRAIKMASGEYVCWVHSDDYIPKDSLKDRVEFFDANPDLDFIHANVIKVDENDKEIKKLVGSDLLSREMFMGYCKEYYKSFLAKNIVTFVHHSSFLIKKDFFEKVGYFDESLPYAGDFDWFVKALKVGNTKHLNKNVYFYRSHSQTARALGTAKGLAKKELDEAKVLKKILNRYCPTKI